MRDLIQHIQEDEIFKAASASEVARKRDRAQITASMVMNWVGFGSNRNEQVITDLVDTIVRVANNRYPPSGLKEDILEYNEE